MRSDDDLGFVSWLEVFSDPTMKELALLAGLILCLGITLLASGVML